MKSILPNTITSLNLLSGCLGLYFFKTGEIHLISFCIFSGAFFDFFDGLTARALNVQSSIGKELDSLADMVTFGILPGLIAFSLLDSVLDEKMHFFSFLALIIPLCSALRLAKFNVSEDQSTSFKGLPTPANAIFFASFPLILNSKGFFENVITNPIFLCASAIGFSILLVSNMPLFALKLSKDQSFLNTNTILKLSFLGVSGLLILFFLWSSIPIILALYLMSSLFIK